MEKNVTIFFLKICMAYNSVAVKDTTVKHTVLFHGLSIYNRLNTEGQSLEPVRRILLCLNAFHIF